MNIRNSSTPVPLRALNKTENELNNPDIDGCVKCPFWKTLHNHPDSRCFCAYLLMAHHMRGCDAGSCVISQRIEEFNQLPESVKRPYGHQIFCDPGIEPPEYQEAAGM